MKKTIWICFLCLVMFLQSCGSSYKVIESKGIGEFIIPPDTYWGYKENGEKKYGYDRYYYVLFCGLSKNYLNSISALNQTQSWSGNDDYFKKEFNQLERKAKAKDEKVEFSNLSSYMPTSNFFKCIPINSQNSGYLIQIDYDSIVNGDRIKIISNFSKLAKDLLIEISEKENKYDWPTSISQNITEKVFEHIPIPQEASLARYGWAVSNKSSFLLLNPKISLKVDLNTFNYTEDPNTKEPWYYSYSGKLDLDFYRSDSAKIVQSPFVKFQSQKMPPNGFNPKKQDDTKSVLISTTSDIQLSDNSKNTKFIALYQNYMKRNSSYSKTGLNDSNFNKDDDIFIGNSHLVFSNDLSVLLNNPNENSLIKGTISGPGNMQDLFHRILIQPMIFIYINDYPMQIQLGTNIFKLKQQLSLSNKIFIKRNFGDDLAKIKNFDDKLILLPGDKILY